MSVHEAAACRAAIRGASGLLLLLLQTAAARSITMADAKMSQALPTELRTCQHVGNACIATGEERSGICRNWPKGPISANSLPHREIATRLLCCVCVIM